jgi:hypothetical protein
VITNNDAVSFYSGYNVDKIVSVFQGTFDNAVDTQTRTGDIGSFNYYTIRHDFPRPLFTELLWSTDNITYVDGGSGGNLAGERSISYSDSVNAYIVAPAASGTTYYKLICSWIDDYDDQDWYVEPKELGSKPLVFDTRANYQKIFEQDVLTFNNTGVSSTRTVIHNLGYTPNAKLFVEDFDGEVWSMNFGGATNPFSIDTDQAEASFYVDATILSVTAFFVTGVKRIWYRIYRDG